MDRKWRSRVSQDGLLLPSCDFGNVPLEVVITSLLRLSALLSERTGLLVEGPFVRVLLPVSWGNLIKAKIYSKY